MEATLTRSSSFFTPSKNTSALHFPAHGYTVRNATDLPNHRGASGRTLTSFQGLYIKEHLPMPDLRAFLTHLPDALQSM